MFLPLDCWSSSMLGKITCETQTLQHTCQGIFRNVSLPRGVEIHRTREYWMIYRWPVFLAVVWFGSSLTPSPPAVSKLSLFLSLPVCRRLSIITGEGGGRWGRSQIIRRRESLVLHKSFNTLYIEQRQRYFAKFFILFLVLKEKLNYPVFPLPVLYYWTLEHLYDLCSYCNTAPFCCLKIKFVFYFLLLCLGNTIRMHRVVFVLHCLIVAGFSYL
jgi:hypothetical protein